MPPRRHESPVRYVRDAQGRVVGKARLEPSGHYVRYEYSGKGKRGRPRKRASKHKWKPRLKSAGVRQYMKRIGGASRALGSAVRAYQRAYVRKWRRLSPGGIRPSGWLQAAASQRVATASQVTAGRLKHRKRKGRIQRPLVTGGRRAFIQRFLAQHARRTAVAAASRGHTATAANHRHTTSARATAARRRSAPAARRSPYRLRNRNA